MKINFPQVFHLLLNFKSWAIFRGDLVRASIMWYSRERLLTWLARQAYRLDSTTYLLPRYPNSGPFLFFEIWVIVCENTAPKRGSSTWKEERKKKEEGGEKEKVLAAWGQGY